MEWALKATLQDTLSGSPTRSLPLFLVLSFFPSLLLSLRLKGSPEYKERLLKAEEEFSTSIIAKANTIVSEHGLDPKDGSGEKGWKLVHEPITVHREDPRDVITEYIVC